MYERITMNALSLAVLLCSTLALAHPGHEYHVEGTVTKLRAPHFEVEARNGGPTSFLLVAGTEVFLNGSRATATEIAVGLQAEVDGVENERGLIEAKKVKLTRQRIAVALCQTMSNGLYQFCPTLRCVICSSL